MTPTDKHRQTAAQHIRMARDELNQLEDATLGEQFTMVGLAVAETFLSENSE